MIKPSKMADSDTSYTIETEQQLWEGAHCFLY